ncbi:MOSC domain-containing protein [Mangrovitalea sediminis]|uniref:MOSC domain-containing protein n=1 Tax=Mangrovitalea sediminis TaxID=1982043 RepID=UPI000BE4E357|nr:MOSC N-terminal beta barrel domain-containing protein [Mangrovitalea sediminis]
MKVTQLFRYPVKSLPGLPVAEISFDDFGPRGDRRWMIVDAHTGRFVTQRLYPQLAMVDVSVSGDSVQIALPGGGVYALEPSAVERPVTVWRDAVLARVAEGEVSARLGAWLGTEVLLVYMPEESFRQIDPVFVEERRRVSFADGYPLLVVTESSLKQVCEWVGRPLSIRRFRPSIVLDGDLAFAEDLWSSIRINGLDISLVKPCSRCVMTTVDPDLGKRDADGEPLKTLKQRRSSPSGALFGQNGLHRGLGTIRVGDEVEVLETPLTP